MNKFLNVAKTVSKTSTHYKVKIGACIVKSHTVIATGTNNLKSHPLQKLYNQYRQFKCKSKLNDCLHAEMSAIIKAEKLIDDLTGATLYVYREDKNGNLAMCKPCPACMKRIKEVGISKIVYTTVDGINILDRRKDL